MKDNMTRKIRTDFALPSISTLGQDRINVNDHNMLVNFIAALTKRDKHTSGRKAKASAKRKKGKAHKRGPYFLQKSPMGSKTKNNLHIEDLFEPLEVQN